MSAQAIKESTLAPAAVNGASAQPAQQAQQPQPAPVGVAGSGKSTLASAGVKPADKVEFLARLLTNTFSELDQEDKLAYLQLVSKNAKQKQSPLVPDGKSNTTQGS